MTKEGHVCGGCKTPASCRTVGCQMFHGRGDFDVVTGGGGAAGGVFLSPANTGPMQQGAERVPCRLNQDSAARKNMPVVTGVLHYFPKAIAAVARLSKIGNDKHNPGEPMHWSREKSGDHIDCIGRHTIDSGTLDPDGVLHDVMLAWRALANLELKIEDFEARGLPYLPE